VFGHRPRLAHSHRGEHSHHLRRQVGLTIAVATLLAVIALLLLPPHANGNFVYWANNNAVNSIGRAKINGTGTNNGFISGLGDPRAVAVDSKFVYWTQSNPDAIGRANLDGSGANPNFITTGVSNPEGIAVTQSNGIYWANTAPGPPPAGLDTIGHANIDGSNPVPSFITTTSLSIEGVAADQSFVYWLNSASPATGAIGRAPLSGGSSDSNFISGIGTAEGMAVDPSFAYWTNDTTGIGRAPVGGGAAEPAFIPGLTTANPPRGVAVNSQYVFWSDADLARIGRANVDGGAVNPNLTAASTQTGMMAAAPSNKLTINSITRKKKKGTAVIDATVPGPGQVTLNQTAGAQDPNATAAAVKQIGLTITQASSFTLPVKPIGKTAKKLNKQIKKQLLKKRKAKAKVKQQVFITFVPAGVAGVPNTEPLTVKLVKTRTKKK
jgi:hypothetical protein